MSAASAFRATRVVRLGQYSRMMDLGGMPPSSTKHPIRTVDGSKNCKLQLVAFDFHVLTNSVDKDEAIKKHDFDNDKSKDAATTTTASTITVLVDKVQEIASLLHVNLGDNDKDKERAAHDNYEDDDLSALTGQVEKKPSPSPTAASSKEGPKMPFATDVRSKYADKLKSRGGLSSIDNAKRQVEDTLAKGDAAGHLAARAAAMSQTAAETKWLALTGTGSLLTYISNRSMKIALLPLPSLEQRLDVKRKMEMFTKQLSLVSFDLLIDKGEDAKSILQELQDEFDTVDPVATMVVSDRDDYLKAAKEEGMVACRIRPKNARRGNISAHYNVETVGEVQDVVDEINGISFQATRAVGGR